MAYLLKEKKEVAAATLKSTLERDPQKGQQLINEMLDVLMEPTHLQPIRRGQDLAEWLRNLFGGGESFDKFCSAVRVYDKSPFCGCVWTANFVAYRCKTCATSPCMSICAACFENGDHEGHEYNIFRSEAGGACDCGDASVMSEAGFCRHHGINREVPDNIPSQLLALPKILMERMLLLLLHTLRLLVKGSILESSFPSKIPDPVMETVDLFIEVIKLGSPIREFVSNLLQDEKYYFRLNTNQYYGGIVSPELKKFHEECYIWFPEAAKRLPISEAPDEFKNKGKFGRTSFKYKNLLEELMFWTVRFEFPETLILFLLNMLPESSCKQAFARTFVRHYIYIAPSLSGALHVEQLSNRIVHISVQLFSNNDLACTLAKDEGLLEIFMISLHSMVTNKLIDSETSDSDFHQTVATSGRGLRNNSYWAIVSDLVNCLGHNDVALLFLNSEEVMKCWMHILLCFSGMNLSSREMDKHVEYDPQNVLLAFYTEREACAAPMWVLLDVLRDASTLSVSLKVINLCLETIIELLDALGVDDEKATGIPFDLISFHYPVHRYFALFVSNAISRQGLGIRDLEISQPLARRIMGHALQVLCTLHEIQCNMWVRNGMSISTQSLAYKQSFFCTFFIDADLFFLQLCSCYMSPDIFVSSVFDRCRVTNCLTVNTDPRPLPLNAHGSEGQPEDEKLEKMLESAFFILASTMSIATHLGISDKRIIENELVALLCTQSWTHSGLSEHIPQCHDMHAGEKSRRFTEPLSQAIDCLSLTVEGDAMTQTQYSLRDEAWDQYDPIFTSHRSMYKKNVQQSHVNYFKHLQQNRKLEDGDSEGSVWPPYQPIRLTDERYSQLNRVLNCRTLHTAIFMILYKYVHAHPVVTDKTLIIAIHLLEAALWASPQERGESDATDNQSKSGSNADESDWQRMLDMWFSSDNMSVNIRQIIDNVQVTNSDDLFHDAMETNDELKKMNVDAEDAPERCVVIQESIITLLIKLHDKFSFRKNSFTLPAEFVPNLDPPKPVPPTGPNVISRVLLLAASKSPETEKTIIDICGPAPPAEQPEPIEAKYDSERERRRKKAREMQQKLLKDFASQRKQFLEKAELEMKSEEGKDESMVVGETDGLMDCVICGASEDHTVKITGDSETERHNSARTQIIGLVCFVQTSGVLGFQTESDVRRPFIPPGSKIKPWETCRKLNQQVSETLERKFPAKFSTHSIGNNIDWEISPHISTCGHYLHVGCHQDYMRWVERDETGYLRFESGLGFQCPLCRQTSNLIIPCNVIEGRPVLTEQQRTAFKSSTPKDGEKFLRSINDIKNIIGINEPIRTLMVPISVNEQVGSNEGSSIDPPPLRQVNILSVDEILKTCRNTAEEIMAHSRKSLDADIIGRLNLPGVLRGQIEYDLHRIGGHLTEMKNTSLLTTPPRKIPIGPMFHVLCKVIRVTGDDTNNKFASKLLDRLTKALSDYTNGECPLMLKDPISLVIELCVALYPLSLEEYQTVVQVLYNVSLIQALVQISCKFSSEERRAWKTNCSVSLGGVPFADERIDCLLGHVIHCLPKTLFDSAGESRQVPPGSQCFTSTVWSPQSVQSSVEELLLHFLQVTALLQFHVFKNMSVSGSFPLSKENDNEFVYLAKYLGLLNESSLPDGNSPCSFIARWPDSARSLISSWCKELDPIIVSDRQTAVTLLNRHRVWKLPSIVDLPEDYTSLFTKFRDTTCENCKFVSREPALCLMCGNFVCYKGMCQHPRDVYVEEDQTRHRVGPQGAAVHARQCGNGTVALLNINATTVIVVRGPRSCVWGTLYLDHHGEEDRGWKRGRKLTLKRERMKLLNEQWLNHVFDNACKNWKMHRNQL